MKAVFDIRDLLLLSSIPGVGANRLKALVTHFGSPTAALSASPRDLVRVEGIEKKLASSIAHFQRGKEFVEDQLSRLNKINGQIITLWDENYPESLSKIYDPPPFLFVSGSIEHNDKYALAIVGTRHPTPYGKLIAERFAQELVEKGITIVSGLARGIDTIAHHTAVNAFGRTIAVIGSSLDIMYPAENKKLAAHIAEKGAVISEFFMGTKPDPGNFPRRNRIISGMSLGTLIVETAENGGAMITASAALDQNRELFCIPGHITEKYSSGTNKLIRDGHAKLVLSVEDIVAELEPALRPILKTSPVKPSLELSAFEQKIYDLIGDEAIHIDVIAERSTLSISDALVNLLSLEFKGAIRQLAGKMFVRT